MTEDELRDAYLATRINFMTGEGYLVETVPEDFPGSLDITMAQAFGLDVSEVWCISAENPRSEVLGDEENIARNQELTDLLLEKKLPILFGFGESPDGAYWESTTLVGLRLDEDIDAHRIFIVALARHFGQNAVFRFVDDIQELVPVLNQHFVGQVKYRLRDHTSYVSP
jgi:hypothetical protein